MNGCIRDKGKTLVSVALAFSLFCASVNAQDVVTVTTASGGAMSFKTFGVKIAVNAGDLQYDGAWLDGIYATPQAIPIKRNGVFHFVPIEKISQYEALGNTVTLTLLSGERLSGMPLSESKFGGETALGEVWIEAPKVKTIRSNAERLGTGSQTKKPSFGAGSWPDNFKSSGQFTLSSASTLSLQNVALVYEESGCDRGWIPCRSYTTWRLMPKIPVKVGDFAAELDLAKVTTIELLSSQAGTSATPVVSFSVALDSGERLNATLNSGTGLLPDKTYSFRGLAFLGTDVNGYVHVPLGVVKTITFRK